MLSKCRVLSRWRAAERAVCGQGCRLTLRHLCERQVSGKALVHNLGRRVVQAEAKQCEPGTSEELTKG